MQTSAPQVLLSLPPNSAKRFQETDPRVKTGWFATSDPPGGKLGSGGGTAHLLHEAWKAAGASVSLSEWLQSSSKLIVHGGGQSRRLPAYAAEGKPLMPLPVLRGSFGQRLDQTLLDMQLPDYCRVLAHAARSPRVMITSGDVLLRFGHDLPPFPEADVLALGMPVPAETARHFGVFFLPRRDPGRLAFFLQKPETARIHQLAEEHRFLVDTGIWILSERAVNVLFQRCGWDADAGAFTNGQPDFYELYARFGLALGEQPVEPDPLVGGLSCAVAALPSPEFYHLGNSRQLIESVSALQNRSRRDSALAPGFSHPDQILQNSDVETGIRPKANQTLWIENSCVPRSWHLAHDHVITGVPRNAWEFSPAPGVCLDFAPVRKSKFCLRLYGIDDVFRGAVDDRETIYFGAPAPDWFEKRGVSLESAGIAPGCDLQSARIFPVLDARDLAGNGFPGFLEWLSAPEPAPDAAFQRIWLESPRLSAQEAADQTNLERLQEQRDQFRMLSLRRLCERRRFSIFYQLDLETAAAQWAAAEMPLPEPLAAASEAPLQAIHEHMWRAAVLLRRNPGSREALEEESRAFACLSEAILQSACGEPARPRLNAQSDQIVWGRAPVRLDLAGGWADTPPYCLQHGGRVTNVAVNLNGQPPLQVFAKPSANPEIVIRSIDLGVEQRITTYEELDTYAQPGSEFALGKAALALAGFLPRFHADGGFGTLRRHLRNFGSGLELSLLAAIPAGSGLGTSSILGATLLAALNELCGLDWDQRRILSHTFALEQMLTTGGGWQDQFGGVLPGMKTVETAPGLDQAATVRWLPDMLFSNEIANRRVLLYYTGITRLAKNILQEIVRGMFLNESRRLEILYSISENASFCADALQRADWDALCESIRRSWDLNQRLDAGTNPPVLQKMLEAVQPDMAACKLLGAGGGGFLLILARDEEAAARIRRTLTAAPPNPRARFVNLSVSQTGMEVTRS